MSSGLRNGSLVRVFLQLVKMYLQTRRALFATCLLWAAIAATSPVFVRANEAPLATTRPATQPSSTYECRWIDESITIDGKADEVAWKNAQSIDHFAMPWLGGDARNP